MRRLLALLFVAVNAHAAEIHVSAAASLTDVVQELAKKYEAATRNQVVMNFGSSGSLARQILEGAPVDVFISADERQMDRVAKIIVTSSRRSIISNTLVAIVPGDSVKRLQAPADLARSDVTRIAVGDPETVPAGAYARAYLRRDGVWNRINLKLVPMESVRAALAAVESGNVDCGIVYRSDALISHMVRIAFTIDGSPAISYPAAVISESKVRAAAQQFLDLLSSDDAAAAFARYGFTPTRRSAR